MIPNTNKSTALLNCTLCDKPYNRPRYFPCYHSYCEECIASLLKQRPKDPLSETTGIACPECGKINDTPSREVNDFPSNNSLTHLMDEVNLRLKIKRAKSALSEFIATCDKCSEEDDLPRAVVLCVNCIMLMCSHCHDKHSTDYQSHNVIQVTELKGSQEVAMDIKVTRSNPHLPLCSKHNSVLDFYCDTCERLVCQSCATNEHNGHVQRSVKDMADTYKKELGKILEPMEEMADNVFKLSFEVSNTEEDFEMQRRGIDQEIDEYYEKLHQQLDRQKERLKKKLVKLYDQKKKAVYVRLNELQNADAKVEEVKEMGSAIMNTQSDHDVFFTKKYVDSNVARLTNCYDKLNTKLTGIGFAVVEECKESFPQFAVVFSDDAFAPNCEAIGIPEYSPVGSKIDFKIVAKDCNNCVICPEAGNLFTAHVQAITGDVIPIKVIDDKEGAYSACFVPKQVGALKVSVTIKGENIKGSPYFVTVYRDYKAIDRSSKVVNDSGNMGSPFAIAYSMNLWAVTDDRNSCVYLYDDQDQLVRKFGSKGTDKGQFQNPWGIAFDGNSCLYVSEFGNNRVQKFDSNGDYVLQFGSPGSGDGQLNRPMGMTVVDNKVFVADGGNRRISVYLCDGRFCRVIGSGCLLNPCDLTFSAPTGKLLVTDSDNNCVFSYTLDGRCLGRFDEGKLRGPAGIVADRQGFVLVTEKHANQVTVFYKDGTVVHKFGTVAGHLNVPYGIAIGKNGNVYVADCNNKRVQIF